MEIQSLSVNLNQALVQEQAAVQVQAMAIGTVREQAAAVEELVSSVQPIVDPNLGQRVNVVA
jgi:hypothetical protein